VTRGALVSLLALTAAVWCAGPAAAGHRAGDGPAPKTPIEHVITLMQGDHSFDNYFGTYPGADGIPADTCMPVDPTVRGGKCIKPFHIENQAIEDLSHSARVARAQRRGGRMDGFVSAIAQERGRIQPLVMGHYDDRDIPFYWNVADNFVLFDRFFTSASGGSLTNHMYWVSGGPGNKDGNSIPKGGFDDPTIFDRLEEKGVSWKFYVQNYDPGITFHSRSLGDRGAQVIRVPLLNYARFVDAPELFSHIVPVEEFYEDLRRGTLPAVSYIVPSGSSEHPPGSIKAGETFVRTLINGLMRSTAWSTSAFTWTYDDWGGWYDHVRPPQVDQWGYGFRVPSLLVSPYAKQGHVEHATMDFTSILKFIEANWGLEPLTDRDRRATSLGRAMDFGRPPREAVFLSRDRQVEIPPEPRRAAVYVSYSAAVAFAVLVIGFAMARDRFARRSRRRLNGHSHTIRIGDGDDPVRGSLDA
jgi:phospholipase C